MLPKTIATRSVSERFPSFPSLTRRVTKQAQFIPAALGYRQQRWLNLTMQVIAANHLSHLDPFVLSATLGPERLEQTYWAAWVGATRRNPLTRLGSRLARTVQPDELETAGEGDDRASKIVDALRARIERLGEQIATAGDRKPGGRQASLEP